MTQTEITLEEIFRLEMRLQGQLGNQIRDLRLKPQGLGLSLHGRASSYHAKQLAQHAFLGATSLPLVANQIEMK